MDIILNIIMRFCLGIMTHNISSPVGFVHVTERIVCVYFCSANKPSINATIILEVALPEGTNLTVSKTYSEIGTNVELTVRIMVLSFNRILFTI